MNIKINMNMINKAILKMTTIWRNKQIIKNYKIKKKVINIIVV